MSPPSPDPLPALPAARPTRPRPPVPSLDTVRLVLAPALVFIVTGLDRGYQTELWQHLARGRLVARHHEVVSFDTFTFTVLGRPFVDNNWLTQLLYHALHSLGGLELLQLVNSLALAAAVALLVRLCRRASGSARLAGALGAAAFLGLWQTLLIRPQSVSMLLFVVLCTLLTAAARGRPALLAFVPPVMALWANVHGGFAIGLVLILTFAAPVAWRHLRRVTAPSADAPGGLPPLLPWLACPVAGLLATLLNPYGPSVYRYAGDLSAIGVARGIEEWLPPSAASLVGASFFASVAAVAALLVVARRRVILQDLITLGCFAAPAFVSVRMTVWWFLAAAPVVARLAGAPADDSGDASGAAPTAAPPRAAWAASVTLAGIAAVCVASLPWFERHSPLFGVLRPAHRTESDLRAVAGALAESAPAPGAPSPSAPRRRVFATMEWSNYLAWQTDGGVKVFAEGHVELYPPRTWAEYVTVNDARPGWDQVLDRYGVRYLVLDRAYHAALQAEVRRSSDWSEKARSGDAVLFERRARGAPGPSPSAAGAASAGGEAGDF